MTDCNASKGKRILYVITKSNLGGAQRYVLDLATALQDEYEVAVACGGHGLLVEKLRAQDITVMEISHFQRNVSVFKELRAFFALYSILKEFQPDIVHLNSTKAGVIGAVPAGILRVPHVIFTAHGWPYLEPRNSLFRLLTWLGSYLTAQLVDEIIMVSHNDQKHAPTQHTKTTAPVIHTAVTLPDLPDRTTTRHNLYNDVTIANHIGDFWLVSLAELNYNKNLAFAIKAVIEHNRKHELKIFYTILGDGVLMEKLQSYITHHGVESHIQLRGYVPDGNLQLNGFDGFLLPSKKEGLPYALLEAGAAGLPAIASAVGGIPEVIKNGYSGWLIDPYEQKTLATALAELVHEPGKTKQYAHNLKNTITTDFTLSVMIAKTKAVYDSSTISRTL